MRFKYEHNNFILIIVSAFLFVITHCPKTKAESISKTTISKDIEYELIKLINPSVFDPEIEKIIQVDTLKETAFYFDYEWVEALRTYHRELIAQKELGNYKAQGDIYKKIAYAYSALGVIDRKIEYYQYAIQAYSKTNNQISTALVFNKLGESYLEIGELEEAEKYLEIAYWIFKEQKSDSYTKYKIEYASAIGNNLAFLTQVSLLKGKNKQAVSYAEQVKDFRISNYISFNIGEIYLQAGETEKAIEYFDKKTKSCKISRFSYRSIQDFNSLAEAYIIEGNIPNAVYCYNQALSISKKDIEPHGDSFFGLAKVFVMLNDKNQARSHFF